MSFALSVESRSVFYVGDSFPVRKLQCFGRRMEILSCSLLVCRVVKLASILASLVVTKKMCCRSCVSSVGTVQLVVWQQLLASDHASSFLKAFVKSLQRILVRSDNKRSLLSLIERLTSNLMGVELVMMTSPEGDHQANGLAEVGVRDQGSNENLEEGATTWQLN